MKSFTTLKNYFSKTELILWSTSVVLILIAFCLFDRTSYISVYRLFLNIIISDIPIYNWATKKELSALKRGFYIKRTKEKRKKHSHVQKGTTKAA